MMWNATCLELVSKGSCSKKPGSLAGLHEARQQHHGQFFTPEPIAKLCWQIASAAVPADFGRRVRLLDNSVGSGRLLSFATPDQHELYGIDIDERCIDALSQCAEQAGFTFEFRPCSMEALRVSGMDIAIINPAFSLSLCSPVLEPFACTRHGSYGPNTSSVSHEYALYQAVMAAHKTIAILPWSFADTADRLPGIGKFVKAILQLPASAFRAESAEVSTGIVVIDRDAVRLGPVYRVKVDGKATPPALLTPLERSHERPRLSEIGFEPSVPAITTPVTGDNRVRLYRRGKMLKLRFHCGAVEAEVLNALYQDFLPQPAGAERHRYPKGYRFTGEGVLDLEAHVLTGSPLASLQALQDRIRQFGATPVVDHAVVAYLKRRQREFTIQKTPLRHWVYQRDAAASSDQLEVVAKETFSVNPRVFGSPVVKQGGTYKATRTDTGFFLVPVGSGTLELNDADLKRRFTINTAATPEWVLRAPGRVVAFPGRAQEWRTRIENEGIAGWFDRPYQLHDLTEIALTPGGVLTAWDMAVGKARCAIALCLLGGRHNLIVVEAGLVPEMEREISALPIASSEWQIIRNAGDVGALRRINIISYERLRSAVYRGAHRTVRALTFANVLRNRIHTLVADEGDCIRNIGSQQSQAMLQVSAKKPIILAGSPLSNYPRDIHPQLVFCLGDGVAHQPYGWHRPYISETMLNSAAWLPRGIDRFRDDFIVTEWVTNEFCEDNRQGAKREVPKIRNLAKFRALLAPAVKRRLIGEPEVEPFLKIPAAVKSVHRLEWDDAHLAHFIKCADGFSQWYRRSKEVAGRAGKQLNLVALLARIGAVTMACNFPQSASSLSGFATYRGGLTSKQRWAVGRAAELAKAGNKIIVYVQNPENAELLSRTLWRDHQIDSITYHGKQSISKRTKDLNEAFRFGACPVMFATLGVCERGLNLEQANYELFAEWDWSATVMEQALRRFLRPRQTRTPYAEYAELPGGIDTYMRQMVTMKAAAAGAGLDWGEQDDDVEFQHLDTIIYGFVRHIAEFNGMTGSELREMLARAA